MDNDVTMYVIGAVLTVLFFIAITSVIAYLTKHDLRAADAEHRPANDFSEDDLDHMSTVVEGALREFSVNHISQEELNHAREDATAAQ
jgi:hypothetical protein